MSSLSHMKKGLLPQKLLPIFISVVLLCLGIVHGSIRAASTSVIIAASNSSSTWKSQATAVCSGTNDQNKINSYLTNGNTVELAPGTYNCNGQIIPASNTTLYGQGNTTIINLGPNYSGNIQISNVSNVNIGNLEIEGTLYYSAVYITATSAVSNFNIYGVKCLGPLNGSDCFSVYANGATISNITFSQCDASSPDGVGFRLGSDNGGIISGVTFYKDTAENDGIASTRSNIYMVGFDLADSGTVRNIYVIDCAVHNSWESCFHIETAPIKNNVVITGCNAVGAGYGNSGYMYGFGFLIHGDVVFYNNTASSNAGGDLYLDGGPTRTPVINGITPSTSTKTATAVNQGNCSGVIINIDATHKELVLYSNDGNPVSQQLELGGNYSSADGNTYSFNGTKIQAQFTNYAVMNLVASSAPAAPVVTTNAASGLTVTSATLNASLTSVGASSNVTTEFEYGLTTAYGNTLAGIPPTLTTIGTFTVNITGLTPNTQYHYRADAIGNSTVYGADQTFTTLTAPATLAITTNNLPNGTVGAAYSQTLSATGGNAPYSWTVASGTLPAGLSLSSGGVISGTPTTAGGPTALSFRVTDSASATATKSLSITISNAAPSISTGSLPNGTVGTAYSQTLTATGGTAPYSWTVVSGTLPAGLSLSSGGVISGTPTTAGGPTALSFRMTDSASATATKSLSITISNAAPSISTGSLPNGTVGTAYSQNLTATGGNAPYSWTVASGTLPAGLSLSSSGVISGTPTTAGGPTALSFRMTDSASATATKSLSITISNAAPSISTGSLPNGTVGTAYSQNLTATGGNAPYSWIVVSGTLPAGLSLSSGGVISGTPTTAGGPTALSFQLTDSASATATKSLSITISNAAPSISTGSLPNGTVGTAYSQTLTATGGTAPYSWTVVSGTLPAGLSLSSGGVISGTPTTAGGPTALSFRMTDSASATATKSLSITISNAAPSISTGSLPNGTVGTAYSQNLTATGGNAPYSWTLASGTLPAGLSLSSGGVISGSPTTAGGPTALSFQLTDSASTTATKSLSITISNAAPSISTSSLPNGTVGTAYSQTLSATGGTAPYSWTVASGTLPAGLSLSSGGVISGSPTTAGGPTALSFQLTDSASTTATKSLSITVNDNGQVAPSSINTGSGGGGAVSSASEPIGPITTAGTADVTSIVNAQGVFNQEVKISSNDNNLLLQIPAGTVGLTSNGAPETQISITPMTTSSAFQTSAGRVSLVYDCTPSGTTFNPPAIIRLSYNPTLVPAGIAETSLQIAYYDNSTSTWITLPSTVDNVNHIITAQISHFTPYAVTYGVNAATPAPTTLTMTAGTQVLTTTAVTTTPTTSASNISPPNPNPIETTTAAVPENTSTPVVDGKTNTIDSSMTTSTSPPTNTPEVRMYILGVAIGGALFMIAAIATFIWLRHRDLLKKS